jgi:hypothetical protein
MSDRFGVDARFTASRDDDESSDEMTDRNVSKMLERWLVLHGQDELCVEVPRQRERSTER